MMAQLSYLAVLQTQDLLDILDLSICADLGSVGIADIQQFSPVKHEWSN